MSNGEVISGFAEENGWICAFKDVSPNHFGFVPKNYLKFEHRTNSQTLTPKSDLGGKQGLQTSATKNEPTAKGKTTVVSPRLTDDVIQSTQAREIQSDIVS